MLAPLYGPLTACPEGFTQVLTWAYCLLAGPGPGTSAPGARLAGAENIGRSEVVPATTLADLNDIRPELAIFGGHLGKFGALLYPPFIMAELIPVHIGDMGELDPAADRAAGLRRLTMELGGTEQVGMRVADVRNRRVTSEH